MYTLINHIAMIYLTDHVDSCGLKSDEAENFCPQMDITAVKLAQRNKPIALPDV